MSKRQAKLRAVMPYTVKTGEDPVSVSIELNLLAAQATEVSVRGFATHAAQVRFFSALADHLNDLASRLWAVN